MNKKIIGYLLLTISVICVILIVILIAQNDINIETSQPNKITLEKFNKIKSGMTYNEVVDIIGEEGTILSETDIMQDEQYKTTVYYWYASNGIANANVTFQGGKVISKAQLGLE